jgi:hypothetical protein
MKKEVVVDKKNNSIQYFEGDIRLSNFHLNDIVAIGEVTMNVGPFADDHFIMIITKSRMWNRISVNAIGFDKLISTIGSQLDITSFIRLANRVDFKSRIIYPKYLEGKEFIKLQLISPKNWIEKISILLGIKEKYKIVALSDVTNLLK